MGDRPLEKGGDERAEGRQQIDLRLVEREGFAALVARHEAQASPLAEQRNDHERSEAEPLDDHGRHVLVGGIRDVARLARRERALEGAEGADREGGRERHQLGRRETVPGERDERRGLGHVADDADALEGEAVRDRRARALEDRACPKLPAGQCARQRMQCLELDARFAGHGNPNLTCGESVRRSSSSVVRRFLAFKPARPRRGLLASLVEAERRIDVRHQRCICDDAEHPAVQPHDEVEDPSRVPRREEQRDSGEEDEERDQAGDEPPHCSPPWLSSQSPSPPRPSLRRRRRRRGGSAGSRAATISRARPA